METDFVKELEKISVGTIRDMYIYLEKVVNDHNLMPKEPQKQQKMDLLSKIQVSIENRLTS